MATLRDAQGPGLPADPAHKPGNGAADHPEHVVHHVRPRVGLDGCQTGIVHGPVTHPHRQLHLRPHVEDVLDEVEEDAGADGKPAAHAAKVGNGRPGRAPLALLLAELEAVLFHQELLGGGGLGRCRLRLLPLPVRDAALEVPVLLGVHDLRRRALQDHPAGLHDDDVVALENAFLVWLHDDDASAPAQEGSVEEVVVQVPAGVRVHGGKRIIQEHQVGLVIGCTRQGDPRLLPAG
mmetsp:Transcript_104595/g.327273  ORF Transcript_104595/g.327273 Transcript_104595/m.327273 type:complete len:236 (-) Transcript_104595:255-962(-)